MSMLPWRAGFGSRCITPAEPMLLAGYAGNSRYHQTVSRDIFARACVLHHPETPPVAWIALDLCGVDVATVDSLRAAAGERFGLAPERLIVNCTHNHSAPNVDTTLWLYYEHSPELDDQIRVYTRVVRDRAIEALADAFAALQPATVAFDQGLAGFAVNRRRSRPGCRHLPGPVDPDVPVLAVHDPGGNLVGACFTYACHTTSLGGRDLNGDYAGYACTHLEGRHPGATFLFLAGCGANTNPLPRYKPELSRAYGLILAEAVDAILARPGAMLPVHAPPAAAETVAQLRLDTLPDRPALDAWRDRKPYGEAMTDRIHRHLTAHLDAGTLATAIPYRVTAWRFGDDLTLLALTGESIVEYALWSKETYGWDRTWVLGYCHHLTPYIPTRHVLAEGGYEGTGSMHEYGYAATFTPAIETTIHRAIRQVAG